jgi:hypothetical protein
MNCSAPTTRRAHQQELTALLDELEERRARLYRLKAGGARRAGLRDVLGELEDLQHRLTQSV